jgi:molybdopterin-containing oxidoreductase family molybdopterin binding subunit
MKTGDKSGHALKENSSMPNKDEVRFVRTVCPAHCGIDACGITAHVRGDRVVKVEPAEFPDPKHRRICLRGLSSLDITYHPDRLQYPMKRVGARGEGKFERISWDDALDFIAGRFKKIAAQHGWPAIAWVLGGPGAGTTKFGAYLRLASLTQSTRVSAWGYGDAGLPCGSRIIFGTQFPYGLLFAQLWSGAPEADMVVVWGANPGESQPLNLMRPIMDAKARGARLVVIDPRYTVTASKADQYIGIKPGTDAALALGLMHVIFEKGLQDDAFLRRHTAGPYLVRGDNGQYLRGRDIGLPEEAEYIIWDQATDSPKPRDTGGAQPALTGEFTADGIVCKPSLQLLMDLAREYNPGHTENITGIEANLIARLAERIGKSNSTIFVTHMGFTRTYHGDISLRGLGTIAALTGNVTATFKGGFLPAVLNWNPFLKAIPGAPSYSRLGILQLYDAVINSKPYPVKAVWFAFINFLNQCANSRKIAEEMFPELDLIVDTELFMTPTARYADILLPVCSYLEFSDLIPHPYPYVQLQQKAMDPLYESKSDVDIAAGLAQRLGFGKYFEGGEEGFIDLILDSGNDSVKDITREKLKGGALPLTCIPEMDQVKPGTKKYPLAFIQGHSRFRTHSMFANVDLLKEMNPDPVAEINPVDATARSISDGDMVTVFNDRSRTTLKARLTEGVRPGVVNITQGWWIDQFKEGSVNHLTHDIINPVQEKVYEPNMHMNDVAVEVIKYMQD